MDSRIERILRKFADETKLCDAVDILEGMPSRGTLTGFRGGPVQTL